MCVCTLCASSRVASFVVPSLCCMYQMRNYSIICSCTCANCTACSHTYMHTYNLPTRSAPATPPGGRQHAQPMRRASHLSRRRPWPAAIPLSWNSCSACTHTHTYVNMCVCVGECVHTSCCTRELFRPAKCSPAIFVMRRTIDACAR